jgi:hypothetical protein
MPYIAISCVFIRVLFTVRWAWEIIENTYYFYIWHYIDDSKEWENDKKNQQTTLNNRLKNMQNKTVITIIFQITVCRFCF